MKKAPGIISRWHTESGIDPRAKDAREQLDNVLAELMERDQPALLGKLESELNGIQPEEVVRCLETGYWSHPHMPQFGEDREAFETWFVGQGLSVAWDEMEWSGSQDHPYWTESAAHCLGWEPEAPAGDGWFKLSIHDSDNGPVCTWARRVAA